ncbi:hypothetical protein M1512_02705 [Patescibacteria group bacterium]|nr:hypothetical protein [Patescibacteria group bacterium]
MWHSLAVKTIHATIWVWLAMPIAIIIASALTFNAVAAQLPDRSIAISSTLPGATTNYAISFALSNGETLGSIGIQFCSNSPIIGQSCSAPSGFNIQNATLGSQSGPGGFSISSLTTANYLILNRSPSAVPSGPLAFDLSGVVNPSAVGTFFARIQTYAEINASGSSTDYGGIAMAIANGYTISATVPPYILFCLGVTIANHNCSQSQGNFIDFGDLSPFSTSSSESQMLIQTNAQNGYSIILSGNTFISGNNVLPPLSSDAPSIPGTSQFGLNLVANSNPAIGQNPQGPGSGNVTPAYATPNTFRFNSGEVIASSPLASNYKIYTISYILNMAKTQPPGVYVTTLTYTGIGNF